MNDYLEKKPLLEFLLSEHASWGIMKIMSIWESVSKKLDKKTHVGKF